MNFWRQFELMTIKEKQDFLDKVNESNRKTLVAQKHRRQIAIARQKEELQIENKGENYEF